MLFPSRVSKLIFSSSTYFHRQQILIHPLRKPPIFSSFIKSSRGLRIRRVVDRPNMRQRQPLNELLPQSSSQNPYYDVQVPPSPDSTNVIPILPLLEQPALVITRQIEMMNLFLGYEQANRYAIMDPNGLNVGFIAEEERGFLISVISRQLFRTHRPFKAVVMDANGDILLKISRPFSFINSYITVSMGKDESDSIIIGEVQQEWHLWRRRYNLFLKNQNTGQFDQFARIDGGFLTWDFYLRDENNGLLGSINRNFVGFGREIFTDTGQYVIRMDAVGEQDPNLSDAVRSMTKEERAVVLACAISIDFDYFSRHSGGSGIGLPLFGIFGGDELKNSKSDDVMEEEGDVEGEGEFLLMGSSSISQPMLQMQKRGFSSRSSSLLNRKLIGSSTRLRNNNLSGSKLYYSTQSETIHQNNINGNQPYRVRLTNENLNSTSTKNSPRINFSNLPKNFGLNQHIPLNDQMKEELRIVLEQFNAPIRYAFAYGSGVFQQAGYDNLTTPPMIDYIFAVSHSQHWHSLNMHQHPDHYSFMRIFGSGAVAFLQDNFGGRVYYNPYVKITGKNIKYGVISVDALCKDLLDWETLYVAGRMHKSIKILRDDARIRLANQVNLVSALRTALLLLPEKFSEEELYITIASLSYTGDFRMIFGENRNKIQNIVQTQLFNFNRLYSNLITSFGHVQYTDIKQKYLSQDMDPKIRGMAISKLPRRLHYKILNHYENKFRGILDKNEICIRIAQEKDLKQVIQKSLREIISKPAITQSYKGILSAGPIRSFKYANAKISKMKIS